MRYKLRDNIIAVLAAELGLTAEFEDGAFICELNNTQAQNLLKHIFYKEGKK